MSRAETAIEERDVGELRSISIALRSVQSPDAQTARAKLEDFRLDRYRNLWKEGDRVTKTTDARAAAALYGNREEASYLLMEAASAFMWEDLFEQALDCLSEARAILETGEFESERERQLQWARHALESGRIFRRQGLLDRAYAEIDVLMEERDRLIDDQISPALLAQVILFLADLEVAQEDWEDVISLLSEALDRKQLSGQGRLQATYWLGQASFEQDREDESLVARARELFEAVLESSEASARLRAQCYGRLARIAMHREEFDLAKGHLDSARASAYDQLLPDERAHHCVFESRLARLRGVGEAEARKALLEEWPQVLEYWHKIPLRAGGVGFLSFKNLQRILSEVLRIVLETEGEAQAFEALVAAQEISTLSRYLEQQGRAVSEWSPDTDELILTYLPSIEGTHLFAQTSRGVTHHWLSVTQVELRSKISSLNGYLRISPRAPRVPKTRSRGIESLSLELSQALLPAAVADQIGERERLTICGVELLHHLPFEVLFIELGQPLGLVRDISYLPSIPVGSQLRSSPDLADALILLGGGEGLGFLGNWEFGFMRWYDQAHAFHGEESNAQRLIESRAAVLQLFGHGPVEVEREIMATVELDGERVGFEEVIAMQNAPRLAMLTACGSWRGPSRRGDGGVGHLATAFLRAGSAAVVLPHADVEAAATSSWSQAFHLSLNQGKSPARAARDARVKLAQSSGHSDPFYHSLLHVVGAGHRPIFSEPSSRVANGEPTPFEYQRRITWHWYLAVAGLLLLFVELLRAINRRRSHLFR